jgi:hypothetical protein
MNGGHKWAAKVSTAITATSMAKAMVQIGIGLVKQVHQRGDTKLYSPSS